MKCYLCEQPATGEHSFDTSGPCVLIGGEVTICDECANRIAIGATDDEGSDE